MIFSKLGKDNLPLWWLVFKGIKTVTRRPPPCKGCGGKEWQHIDSNNRLDRNGRVCTYEPDLSRWMPKHLGLTISMREGEEPIKRQDYAYKEIAVQPRRTKAAICKNCGHYAHKDGCCEKYIKENGMMVLNKDCGGILPTHEEMSKHFKQCNCDHYEPLRVRVKSVQMEDEWSKENFIQCSDGDHYDVQKNNAMLTEEARREGFDSWGKLQDALSIYPKGTKLARIEFEAMK